MIIAFKNKAADNSLTSRLVSAWTNSPWVHCELVFQSKDLLCVSARPGEVAVSARVFGEVVENDLWEFYQLPNIDAAKEREILVWLFGQSMTEYSYTGIIWNQVLHYAHMANGQWFCSELAFWVLWNYGILDSTFDAPANWSPAELRSLVKRSCVEIDKRSLLTS
ncbi:hypothetical protein [Fibrella forsythiae]|uniref:Uncharacterized protein n=1 Tax=Fibrella forsythiae TaxID=2817061 RepID=A0ABS3JMI3_9BACT|nr:hypothetical protein [Fibrella forsythiae]MBO0951221.1 hypothetical protein [Fibrella forsythiae]